MMDSAQLDAMSPSSACRRSCRVARSALFLFLVCTGACSLLVVPAVDAQTVTSVAPNYLGSGAQPITITGTSFGSSSSALTSIAVTTDGSSFTGCSTASWVSSTTLTCLATFSYTKTYYFRVIVSGVTVISTASAATTTCLPSIWSVTSMGSLLLSLAYNSYLSETSYSVRTFIASSQMSSGFVGAGIVVQLLQRSDLGAYQIMSPTLGLQITSGGADLFPVSMIPLTFGRFQSGTTVSVPANTQAYSDPIDFCISVNQGYSPAMTFYGGGNSGLGVGEYGAFLLPAWVKIGRAIVPGTTGTSKGTWSNIAGISTTTYLSDGVYNLFSTVSRTSCAQPAVSGFSAAGIAVGGTITVIGTNFGSATSLINLAYVYGSTTTVCPSVSWVDSTHLTCTTGSDMSVYTTGVVMQVFVSGVITQSSVSFSVYSQNNRGSDSRVGV